MFKFSIRSEVTRKYYERRIKRFLDFIEFGHELDIEARFNKFAEQAIENRNWAVNKVVNFLQFEKERTEKGEITAATLYNFVKAIKLFCDMSDIPISWKRITRGLPKVRRYADDRAPTLEEIQKMIEYPDRRMKAIVCTMASSGIRLGAWDYLHWRDIKPIEKNGCTISAKVTVYAGTEEEYFSFITPEAYHELEKWIDYRKSAGQEINKNTWVLRQLWNTKEGYHHGVAIEPTKLKSSGIKTLIERNLRTQGIRKKSDIKKKRYEFQTDHGFRKWFKTRCELAGMRIINIEKIMGHSIGISDSYYRATETELLEDYLKAVDFLTISEENRLKLELEQRVEIEKSQIEALKVDFELFKKEVLKQRSKM